MNDYIPIIMIIAAVIFVFLIIKEKKKEKKIDEAIIKIDELLNRYQDYKNKNLYETLNTEETISILLPEYFHNVLNMIEKNKKSEELEMEFAKKSEDMYNLAQKIFALSDDKTQEIFDVISNFIIAYFYYIHLLFYNYTNEKGYDNEIIKDTEKNLMKLYLTMKNYDLVGFLKLQKEYI